MLRAHMLGGGGGQHGGQTYSTFLLSISCKKGGRGRDSILNAYVNNGRPLEYFRYLHIIILKTLTHMIKTVPLFK